MKYWGLALLASLPTQAATLSIDISNFQNQVGSANVAIYADKKSWLDEDLAIARKSVVVADCIDEGGVVSVEFELDAGDYAVAVHHDDNDNGKMDTNFIGIPKEPVGLSNGAVPKFGPPKYKDAVFPMGEDGAAITIKLLD